MECIKCNKDIPDDSLYCNFCGKKQVTQKKKKNRSRAGQGSVIFHKGKQRFYARITANEKRISLGYFKSESEAWAAVNKALKDDIGNNYNWTVNDCYVKWSEAHYPNLSKSGEDSYRNAWRYFSSIKNMKMRDVKTSHLQKCVNVAAEKFSRPVCEKIRNLASQLCQFAMKEDLINKNYAQFLELPPMTESETNPFTEDDITILLKNDNDDIVKMILILIYTGLRPTEFFSLELRNIDIENGFLRGGSKTEAGKNRIVPISSKIEKYIEYFYKKGVSKNQKYLVVNQVGNKINLSNFRNRYFYKTLAEIGIIEDEQDHRLTPYSTRHTFATLCDKADIDDNLVIKMIGHTSHKTTERFYIHKTEKDMKEAIEAI